MKAIYLKDRNQRFHTRGTLTHLAQSARSQPLTKYEVDEETKELLQEVLGLAQRVVDLQYDDEMGDILKDMLIEVSDRFDIQSSEVKVTVDDDGTITARIVADEPTQSLPDTRAGIKLVSDNGDRVVEFKKKTELPPGFTLTPDGDDAPKA